MNEVRIDYAKAVDMINQEIAKESPDYVYQIGEIYRSCSNTTELPDGTVVGSCVVGRALISAGADAKFLHKEAQFKDVEGALALLDGFYVTPKAFEFLANVQARQDMGTTWGDATKRAQESVSKFDLRDEF